MVFTYSTISPSPPHPPFLCYMGLDKYENEELIRTGVTTDIWFHVDSVSSAHVYVRLHPGLTIGDLGEDTLEDMCQLVKNNSISGSKMASCKVVYTPWSNLRKDLVGMDVGTVSYHDTNLCRFRRVNKNKTIIKRVEYGKKQAEWNYDEVNALWKEEERLRLKKMNKAKYDNPRENALKMHDALSDSTKSSEERARDRMKALGDGSSGIDGALSQLEGISFSPVSMTTTTTTTTTTTIAGKLESDSILPLYIAEANERRALSDDVCFLIERGWGDFDKEGSDRISILSRLVGEKIEMWECDDDTSEEDIEGLRVEELEVLKAIFGEEAFAEGWNFAVTIEGYQPPLHLFGPSPPPLMFECYNSGNKYPFDFPVFAISGGGLPEHGVKEVTQRLKNWLIEEWAEDRRGEPIIFEMVELTREFVDEFVDRFDAEEKERKAEASKEAMIKAEEDRKLLQEKIKAERRKIIEEAQRAEMERVAVANSTNSSSEPSLAATNTARVKKAPKGKKLNIDPKFLSM